jgi:hypothetical protein
MVLRHLGEQRLAWHDTRLGVPGRFDDDHEAHTLPSSDIGLLPRRRSRSSIIGVKP